MEEPQGNEGVVEVFAVNWPSVLYFLSCETQWRTAATFSRLLWTGIDYTAALAMIAGRKRKQREKLFADLRVMEREALNVWAEAID